MSTQFARGAISRAAAFRLRPGEDVFEGIERVCRENGINNGVIISGVGSLKQASYCVPEDRKDGSYTYGDPYIRKGSFSVTSLSGMICTTEDGSLLPHVHMTIAEGEGASFGGHMVKGCIVSVSLDIVIGEFSGMIMGRRYDEELQMPVFNPQECD